MSAVRSCLICLGSFLIQMVVFGVSNNFGLLYYHLRRDFRGSDVETALIGSFATGLTFLVSPIANIILIKFGFTIHMILSTLLCVVSWLSSSYAKSIDTLIFTYSILWGFGAGLANHAAMLMIQRNFSKRLSLANGVVMSGTGIGTLLLGPLLEFLIEKYEFKWGFRLFAPIPLVYLVSLFAALCTKQTYDPENVTNEIDTTSSLDSVDSVIIMEGDLCSQDSEKGQLKKDESIVEKIDVDKLSDRDALAPSQGIQNNNSMCRRIRKHFGSNFNNMFDKELWGNRSLTLYIVGMATFLFGYFIPFTFLVDYATKQGIDVRKAQFLIGLLSIASTIAKVLFGAVMDSQTYIKRSTVMAIALYSMSLCTLIIPFSTKYWHFICFSLIFGTGEGFFVGQLCSVVVDLLPDKKKVGAAIGNLFASMSISIISGPVVAGSMTSVFKSYKSPFYVAAAVSFIGAIITSFVKLFENNTLTRTGSNNSNSEKRKMIIVEG